MSSKFDYEKKFLPIISEPTYGSKIRELRVKNNITSTKLCKDINISNTTLMHLEQNKINKPYYYWKLICNYFGVDHIEYLDLYNMKENTHKEKLLKLRALSGSKNWQEVGELLNYSEAFITDLLSRYIPNEHHILKINKTLEKFK